MSETVVQSDGQPPGLSSSIRGLPLGVEDPNYNPRAPASIDWGEPGTIPKVPEGSGAINVKKGTYKATPEQIEEARANLERIKDLAKTAFEPEPRKVPNFCMDCGEDLREYRDYSIYHCPVCGEAIL